MARMNVCEPSRAVALLSGGMDSATAAAVAVSKGWIVDALCVDYGQRQRAEIAAARAVAEAMELARFRVLPVDLRALGGSALTDDWPVPKDRALEEIGTGIPSTYVPARNTVLLALALAAADAGGAEAVVVGVNAQDSSGYPDCGPAFIEAFGRLAAVGTRSGKEGKPVQVVAPLLAMTKAEIVKQGTELKVPYELTLSCYDPVAGEGGWTHCGRCDACLLRAKGFAEAGVADPAPTPR